MSIFSIHILLEIPEPSLSALLAKRLVRLWSAFGIWSFEFGRLCGALKTEKVIKFHDILCRRLCDPSHSGHTGISSTEELFRILTGNGDRPDGGGEAEQ